LTANEQYQRDANSKILKENDISTVERQNLMKENEKLRVIARTALDENEN
jgi:hypothetical protein